MDQPSPSGVQPSPSAGSFAHAPVFVGAGVQAVPSLAIALDELMIMGRKGSIAAPFIDDEALQRRPGIEVAEELGGRMLLTYVHPLRLGEFSDGTSRPVWVTPTPFDSEAAVTNLYLPDPGNPRKHVLMLDPTKVGLVVGPRKVFLGYGIEYLLPNGFERRALVSKWEIQFP